MERGTFARYFGFDGTSLGGVASSVIKGGLRLIPKPAAGASAGPGAINEAKTLVGKIGFDEKWLLKRGLEPSRLSLIRVDGDSMSPTRHHGDDIMIDNNAATTSLRDGSTLFGLTMY